MGNTLYIRGGAEAGLSWDQGIALENTGPDQWVWKTDGLKSPVEFKFLINDEIWSLNENFSITPGQIETFRPAF